MNRRRFLSAAGAFAVVLNGPEFAAAAQSEKAHHALRRKVVKVADNFPGAIGVFARTLAPGNPLVAYRAFESFPTASIIKVLIMTTAYVLDELHPGSLDQHVKFHRSELIAGSDFMHDATDGETFTVRQLIVPMIQVSDNTAANMLIGHFGIHTINGVALQAGMNQTHLQRKFLDWYAIVRHSENVSTPADMAHLLYLIETGAHEGIKTIVSPAHCRTMIDVMLGQTDRDAIPAALPEGTPIANKTGEIEGTRNDVAIVNPYGASPWILTVMTKAAYDYSASYAAIHEIARAVAKTRA
ncbi:MAG TPA: serine hydrolase [Candidatus Baltobacteraceae bacterium]|nr:serine hydrolase [Candidatus Baltobacteraceae bacterium]